MSFCTLLGLKECELLVSFNAFRNHALLEILADDNDGADHGRVVGVSGDLVHKGFVNLQDVDGKLLKIAEAGIAGAKVIHRNVYSQCLKRMKFYCRQIGMLHQNAFGKLEIKIAGFQTGFSQSVANACKKGFSAKFGSGNIDGNPLER